MKRNNTDTQISPDEWCRLQELTTYEKAARRKGYKFIAGVDEAGRGPLAGPVVAAVCFIPEDVFLPGINDSKKLSAVQREKLFLSITSDSCIKYAISVVSHVEIDTINILQASIKAMLEALSNLRQILPVDYLLVDGMHLSDSPVFNEKIIKGDAKSQSIAAASILAKVTRDRLMEEYHQKWPDYGFNKHKGYGTKKHIEAIKEKGPCPIHRMTFEPLKSFKLHNLITN